MIKIKDFETGANIQTPLLNGGVQVRIAKNDKEFLQITGKDKTGQITIMVWDPDLSIVEDLKSAKVLVIDGQVDEFNGTQQIKARGVRPADESEYELNELLFVEKNYNEDLIVDLENAIEEIQDQDLYMVTEKLFTEHRDNYLIEPAAMRHHHAALGGMLVHVNQVLKGALAYFEVYKELIAEEEQKLTRDFIISGAILHDIGKFYEYTKDEFGYCNGISRQGALEGHFVIGQNLIKESGRILGLDDDTIMQLGHVCLAHHEKTEWGASVTPATRATVFIAKADQASAHLQVFLTALDEQEENTSEERNLFGNRSVK